MADHEKWELSREEIEKRLQQQNQKQKKKGKGRSEKKSIVFKVDYMRDLQKAMEKCK